MDDTSKNFEQGGQDTMFYDEVSDEDLEAAATTDGTPAALASHPFTYVSGFCC
jgi:hypothetical protein